MYNKEVCIMFSQEVEALAKRVPGSDNPYKYGQIVKEFEKMQITAPRAFTLYLQQIKHYPGREIIDQDGWAAIQTTINQQLKTDQLFSVGTHTANLFKAIGQISSSPHIIKAAQVSSYTLGFAQNLNTLQSFMKPGGGFIDGVKFLDVATSITGAVTFAVQIFGSFMGRSGPSIEEVMLQELHLVSQQIRDLHIYVVEAFGNVHKHLDLLCELVIDCHQELSILVTNKVDGFRNDATLRLSLIDASLDTLRKIVKHGLDVIFTQDLKKLSDRVTARIEQHSISDEQGEVQAIVLGLEKWIFEQAADRNLNCSNLFIAGNKEDSHQNDIKLLDVSNELNHLLGYLSMIAHEMGLDTSKFELQKIVHPMVFNIAVNEYLKLRRSYPAYILDDESKFTEIVEYSKHTSIFIRNIQDEIFIKALFDNYRQAIASVTDAIKEQMTKANVQFQEILDNEDVNLNDAYDDIKAKFSDFIIKCNSSIEDLQSKELTFAQKLEMPNELLLAQALKLDDFSITYSIKAGENVNNFNTMKLVWGNLLHLYPELNNRQCNFSVTINIKGKHFTRTIYLHGQRPQQFGSTAQSMLLFLNNGEQHITITRDPKEATQLVNLEEAIKQEIISRRINLIVQPLLNGDSTSFNKALLHLESARARLLMFAKLIGINNINLHNLAKMLQASEHVKNVLKLFIAKSTMDSTYWPEPQVELIEKQFSQAMTNISVKPCAVKIDETIAQVKLCKIAYLNYKQQNIVVSKSAEEKAQELNISLVDLMQKCPTKTDVVNMVKAIVKEDIKALQNVLKYKSIKPAKPIPGTEMILPIHLAAYIGNLTIMQCLIDYIKEDKNIDIRDVLNLPDVSGRTSLMFAVLSGNIEAVKLIQANEVDMAQKDSNEKTAIDMANDRNLTSISTFLKNKF